MGVALAKYMVAAMGGKLAVAARAAADALYGFSIEFPVRAAPPAPRRATYVSLVGMAVLVVSAEPEQRRGVSELLRNFRMAPLEADNASMAIALLERMTQEGTPIDRLTGAIHVYGGDFFATPRSEWDPETLIEAQFDVQTTMRLFEEANAAYEARMRAS